VAYTDGVVESNNFEDEQYGLERLNKAVLHGYDLPRASEILEYLKADLASFAGDSPAVDDNTFVVLKVLRPSDKTK
jgi:serine phosphatase RsbU (regulator of sigma subunit)